MVLDIYLEPFGRARLDFMVNRQNDIKMVGKIGELCVGVNGFFRSSIPSQVMVVEPSRML